MEKCAGGQWFPWPQSESRNRDLKRIEPFIGCASILSCVTTWTLLLLLWLGDSNMSALATTPKLEGVLSNALQLIWCIHLPQGLVCNRNLKTGITWWQVRQCVPCLHKVVAWRLLSSFEIWNGMSWEARWWLTDLMIWDQAAAQLTSYLRVISTVHT